MKVIFHGPLSDAQKEICMIHADTDDRSQVLALAPKSSNLLVGEWSICPLWGNRFALPIKVSGSAAINFFELIEKTNPFINKDNQKIWLLERPIYG